MFESEKLNLLEMFKGVYLQHKDKKRKKNKKKNRINTSVIHLIK